jgi:hypothetical protein
MSDQPQQEQPSSTPDLQAQPLLQEQQPKNKRKNNLIFAGVILLIAILAGAAFLAGTLMNKKTNNSNGPVTVMQGGPNGGGMSVKKVVNMDQIIPAKELPTVQADVNGVFVSRSGSTFTIGTGDVGITVMQSGSGQIDPQTSYNGPTYEVVLTKNTVVYKDTTQFDPSTTDSSTAIQQTVAIGSLDDLNSMAMISVWGKKTGNRYVADIILYTTPQMKVNGGSVGPGK